MSYTIAEESFDSLTAYWDSPRNKLERGPVFILPDWLRVWSAACGMNDRLYLRSVRQDGTIIGIAPLRIKNKKARFIGSADVCDYLDFAVAPGQEKEFFNALLDDLGRNGINQIELGPLRQDSTTFASLVPLAKSRGLNTVCHPVDVSLEMDLPATWEEYLDMLTAKQRHEVERKLRRVNESGRLNYRCVEDGTATDNFIKLFRASRKDKAAFLTPRMESFFRSMTATLARAGITKFGILELDSLPAAIVMYFDYNRIYLYNSGYDPEYRYLSAGLVCKILCIKDSIQRGKKKFDFLKGGEIYKYHLGGREVPLLNCLITLR